MFFFTDQCFFCVTNRVIRLSCFITVDSEVIFLYIPFCVFTGTRLRKNRLIFFTISISVLYRFSSVDLVELIGSMSLKREHVF